MPSLPTLLVALVLLVAPHGATANFLSYYDYKRTWFRVMPSADVVVRLSDLSGAWPLEMAPWEFVRHVMEAPGVCPSDQRACFRRDFAVTAAVMTADDSGPVLANLSVTVEGVFDVSPGGPRDGHRVSLVHMLTLLLRHLNDPARARFVHLSGLDPETNKTSVAQRLRVYDAPQGIGVGVGRNARQSPYWLSIQVDNNSAARPARVGQCRYFEDNLLSSFAADLDSFLDRAKSLCRVKCLWPWHKWAPVLPPSYSSKADEILERDRRERGNRTAAPQEP